MDNPPAAGAARRRARRRLMWPAALLACWGLAAAVNHAPAQTGMLDPAGCADGTYVADPAANPGLAADCRTLAEMRNQWLAHADNARLPADHLLRAWGRGEAADITDWPGVRVSGEGRVDQLFFTNAGIGGPLPPEIGRLDGLASLRIGGNDFTGRLPARLGDLENLEELFAWGSSLEGPLPPELGRLASLKLMSLFGNDFTGSIPAEWDGMRNLTALSLRDNRLTGPIPESLGGLSELTLLWLERNQLSGPLPAGLGRLSKLGSLRLGGNRLSGSIPAEWGGLAGLTELWIYQNDLSGPLPPELEALSQLESLLLYGNRLSGPVPAEWGGLSNLRELDLSDNRLSGPLPASLGSLTRLTALRASGNRLSGPIPESLGGLGNLEWLYLQNNRLRGPVPEEVSRLRLAELRLDGNLLTGPVPSAPPGVCRGEFAGRFCDEDGSVHEEAVETIAGRGLMLGCEADRFCPGLAVARRHMAAFLYRAYEWWRDFPQIEVPPTELADVPEDAWYGRFARWAAANGVMEAPGGMFRPNGAVTRAEAARMLMAAFDHLQPAGEGEAAAFADLAGRDGEEARAAEGLYAAGVTSGCQAAPRRFCPDRPLTRAQLASFFYRALPT